MSIGIQWKSYATAKHIDTGIRRFRLESWICHSAPLHVSVSSFTEKEAKITTAWWELWGFNAEEIIRLCISLFHWEWMLLLDFEIVMLWHHRPGVLSCHTPCMETNPMASPKVKSKSSALPWVLSTTAGADKHHPPCFLKQPSRLWDCGVHSPNQPKDFIERRVFINIKW